MAAIIERAMQLDPARRFPDLRALGRELLLLAGQRTRVTWQLSFNDLDHSALVEPSPPPGVPGPLPRRRRRWLAAVPALALVLAAGAWATGSLQRFGMRGLAPASPRASLAGLLHQRSAGAAQRPRETPQVTLSLAPERAEAAHSIPAAIASQPGGELPLASADPGADGAPSSDRTPGTTASDSDTATSAGPATAANTASPALHASPTRRKSSARRSAKSSKSPERNAAPPALEYGTNNAPILD
jgi:hypothetical protein